MNCRKTRKYFFQARDQQENIPFHVQKHLEQCSECQSFSREMEHMDNMLAMKMTELPEGLHASIMEAVANAGDAVQGTDKVVAFPGRRSSQGRVAVAAGLAACLVAAGAWLLQPADQNVVEQKPQGKPAVQAPVVPNEQDTQPKVKEVAPAVVEVKTSPRSQKLLALAHNDQSGAIYKKEVDGLARFFGESARLFLPSHRRQTAKQ